MKDSALLPVVAASVLVALFLQGCGGGGSPAPTPAPVPVPTPVPTPRPTPAPTRPKGPYDGSPGFQLWDKGRGVHAMAYNPLYLSDPSCIEHYGRGNCSGPFPNDDVSADWAANMWMPAPAGRGDIEIMKALGVNSVRLYGNRPDMSKQKFLDELLRNDMKAIAGISTFPYNGRPHGCAFKGYNCYEPIKDYYSTLLKQGKFAEDGMYHNAIDVVALCNEPDVWIQTAIVPHWQSSGNNMIKGLVTAFDGVISAEKEAGIQHWDNGELPKLTIAWSYAELRTYGIPCSKEGYIKDPAECGPSIGFMAQFYHAVQDPKNTVGYTPQNNLAEHFKERWVNSFQPFESSESVFRLAVAPAKKLPSLKDQKMYLGEYDPSVNACGDKPSCDRYKPDDLAKDMETILTDEKWADKVYGMAYFQFQTAYNKDGAHEHAYGLFGLVKTSCWKTGYIEGDAMPDHPINCLRWKSAVVKQKAEAVAKAFGGSLPTLTCPCAELINAIV